MFRSRTAVLLHRGQTCPKFVNKNRNLTARMGYDAWGQRRDAQDLDQPWQQWTQPQPGWAGAMLGLTPRGFTGHEHIDDHGIVHMGGRIYDPHLGRFLQADPFVEDSTTLNRYTYVHNNPLAYTDPSGYFAKKLFRQLMRPIHATNNLVANNQYLDAIGMAAACYWGGPVGCGAASALGTYYRGGSISEALKAGVTTGVTAAAFSGLGQSYNSGSISMGEYIVYSGVIGGASSVAQGGNFGHGFASAGLTAAASPAISRMPGGTPARIATAAVVGGTASSITGGKFANGAMTGAMSYAFGEIAGRRGSSEPTDAELDAYLHASGFYDLDTAITWQWGDPLPQGLVDFGAGLGDALTLTGTRHVRGWLDIDGGVDQSSMAYTAGSWSAAAVGGGRLVYMGAAKGYSMMAPSGAAASAFREGLKRPGRFWFGRNWRSPDLSRYNSDAALRAAAGRTNPAMNAYGAGVTYSGATGPCYSDPC